MTITNPEVEQALVGSILTNPDQYRSLRDILKPEDFNHIPFRYVWEAFGNLYQRGLSIDTVTAGDELERMGKLPDFTTSDNHHFGRAALMLLSREGDPEHAASYAVQVQDYAAKRILTQEFSQGAAWAVNGRSAADIQTDMLKRIAEVRVPHKATTRTQSLAQAVSDAYDETDRASRGEILCVPTGYKGLDEMLSDGLYAPDLYIIAGRPGQGKTSLLLSIAKNAAEAGKRILMFTLEMANKEVAMRLIAMESGISFGLQRSGRIPSEDTQKYISAVEKLTNAANPYPIVLNDLPAITISGIRRELSRAGKVDMVIVDYLQLAGADGKYESRVREVTEVSSGLKAIAKEFNVPVFAAAQLSRAVEQRQDKHPYLSDLRESGSIEQDADVVMFIHRPHRDDPLPEQRNLAEVIIAKHRNGEVGTVNLVFRPAVARFESAEVRQFNPNQ